MAIIEEVGLYPGVSEKDYHGNSYPSPALSVGIMRTLLQDCPKKAWLKHPALNPDFQEDDDDKFNIGTAAHAMLLQGTDSIVVCEFDDWKKKDAQEQRKAAKADGYTPLNLKEYARVQAMVSVAEQQLAACDLGITNLRTEGDGELSLFWQEGDIWCKCRPDWMPKDRSYILDYKTTGTSVNPQTIGRHIGDMIYQMQDSWYRRGWRAHKNQDIPFFFFFQEDKEPYVGVVVQLLAESWRDMGDSMCECGKRIFADNLASGEWPGYSLEIQNDIMPASWSLTSWEERRYAILGE